MADLKAVYLAGRIERRAELNEYRRALEADGIEVTSRWLVNPTPPEVTEEIWRELAAIDREDVERADAFVLFADKNGGAGGARHVEFGIALALKKRIVVVGEVENLFQRLPEVRIVGDWAVARTLLLPGGSGA